MRRCPPNNNQFKTPLQKVWAFLVATLIAGGVIAGCLGVFLFLILLSPTLVGLLVWLALDWFGSPYAVEIAVVCAVLALLLGGLSVRYRRGP